MKVKILGYAGLVTLAAALASAQPNGTNGDRNWTQFAFDASHDGYNGYETILSPTTVGNLTVQWSYSSYKGTVEGAPAVANGLVYFTAANSFFYTDYFLYAVEADTGDLVWKYEMPALTFGSPAVGNGMVYIVADRVYALNAENGALVWTSKRSKCAYAPTLVNDLVYVVCNSNILYALNAENGTTIWSYSTKGNIHAGPAVANGKLYVNAGDGNVYALRANTGGLIWQKQFEASLVPPKITYGSGPAVSNGLLYLAVGNHFYALRADTGAIIWRRDGLSSSDKPTIGQGTVYFTCRVGICALDATTGTTIWQYQVTDDWSAFAPVLANGVIYTPIVEGIGYGQGFYTLLAIDASTGQGLWKYDSSISFPVSFPTPAVVNGTIYNYLAQGFSAIGLPKQ